MQWWYATDVNATTSASLNNRDAFWTHVANAVLCCAVMMLCCPVYSCIIKGDHGAPWLAPAPGWLQA
jgi:hypothetical protein